MLKQQENLTDGKTSQQDTEDEELYQRLFKTIARDFIYVEDLDLLLDGFYEELQNAQEENRTLNRQQMRYYTYRSIQRAKEYKANLAKAKNKRFKYKDVTDPGVEDNE